MYNLQSNQFILTQSENYVVYSEYESVFLKDKSNKEIKDMLSLLIMVTQLEH